MIRRFPAYSCSALHNEHIAAGQSEISDSGQNSDQMPYLVRNKSEIYTQARNFEKVY